MCTIQYTSYTIQYTAYTIQCTACTSTVYSVQYIQYVPTPGLCIDTFLPDEVIKTDSRTFC